MGPSLVVLRELSQSELVDLVSEIWEVRQGWRTMIVDPGDEVELELDGGSLNFAVSSYENPHYPDVDVSPNILAVQESPYVKLVEISVRADEDEEITEQHLSAFTPSDHRITEAILVTTGTGPDRTLEEQFYRGCPLIEGEDLTELIDQYADFGLDYEAHL